MRQPLFTIAALFILVGFVSQRAFAQATLAGELKTWHRISLIFDGPLHDESDSLNPFTDYRMEVAFTHPATSQTMVVQGHFAADGDAAETGATSGDQWRVYFSPPAEGTWNWEASFHTGPHIATDTIAGTALAFDGEAGSFVVAPSDKAASDFRKRGQLSYVGRHHLQFQGDKSYFLKGGPAGPETFLAYTEFDGTYYHGSGSPNLKDWSEHRQDLGSNAPLWRDSLGEGIIGALDYLAGEGVNVIAFITMNAHGEGQNVWPWIHQDSTRRFDVSKLDQWERVFAHADSLGIALHLVLQDAANQSLLDFGDLGAERKMYFREMVSRFAHHPGLLWDLAEQSSQSGLRQQEDIAHLAALDPYTHPIFLQNPQNSAASTFSLLLGNSPSLTGPSLNLPLSNGHGSTYIWWLQSTSLGMPWVVCFDEQNPSSIGVTPTAGYPGMVGPDNHDDIRKQALYGNLMAGGAGVEYYFGMNLVQNDMDCEDFRSRDSVWVWNRHALEGFQAHLPFWEMEPDMNALNGGNAWCLSKQKEIYAIYAPEGNLPLLDLDTSTAEFDVQWFDPRRGGALLNGSVSTIFGPGYQGIGIPPYETDQDWLAIVKNKDFVSATAAHVPTFSLELFPVPTRGRLSLNWAAQKGKRQSAVIKNALGMEVWKKDVPAGVESLQLDCGNWPAGIYTLHFTSGSASASRKFTVQ